MRFARSLVATISSFFWPAVIVALPLGITFNAARVYAESAPPPPACVDARTEACADAGPMTACECESGNAAASECACVPTFCRSDAGPTEETLVCKTIETCAALAASDPCAGKASGAACVPTSGTVGSGTCQPAGCLEKNASNVYERKAGLRCVANPGTPSGSSGDPGAPSGDPGASSGAAATGGDGSGCSIAETSAGSSMIVVAPVAFSLLLTLRRRRRLSRPAT